ncbi:MAG: sugar phosphate isomerase/epimerase [Chloroflexi bacterium]|nr:sugar phosphate isomerase/epimerase [Chloroflexota bacterium]
MAQPIIMHVNYCEQGQSIPEICARAADWGFDGVEFRRKRTGVVETPEAYLDAIAGAVQAAGLQQVIFGLPGIDMLNDDPAQREAGLAQAEDFYRLAAQRVPLTVCNVATSVLRNPDNSVPVADYDRQGSFAATDEHWQRANTGFRRLGELAQSLGFRFALEVHMNFLHDLPVSARRLVDLVNHPAVGINLDYGNLIYFKQPRSINESLATIGDRLYYVHLKNSVASGGGNRIATGLGDGEINNRELLRSVLQQGYRGPICIEAPRSGDREWFAQQDLAYVKSVLADLRQ